MVKTWKNWVGSLFVLLLYYAVLFRLVPCRASSLLRVAFAVSELDSRQEKAIHVCMCISSLSLRVVKLSQMPGRGNSSVAVLVCNNTDGLQGGLFCCVHPPTPPA